MFLPTTPDELKTLGWKKLDVILVTGDSYIDVPSAGVSVLGKILRGAGYKVGIIAQPDTDSGTDITRLGGPRLFWGVTGGCVDSMVANYTASGRKRRKDDFTPGGINNRRPDRATIVYCNLIRRYFKDTCPIVLGGIEASLRRVAHYDFWTNRVRRSVLFDAKADYILYGMAESAAVELAIHLRQKRDPTGIRGLCYIARDIPADCVALPSFEEVSESKASFTRMFHMFYRNNDPVTAVRLAQKHGDRYLVQNPPAPYLTGDDLDAVYSLDYERDLHPYYRRQGTVKALETIRFSITTHQGCFGECRFCAIAVHQGRAVRSRSEASIIKEAERMAKHPGFKGTISDVGGATANMYGVDCGRWENKGCCPNKECLLPEACPNLKLDHGRQVRLLRALREIGGVQKVFIASGIRHDMVVEDRDQGSVYLQEAVLHHVSGQMKVAAEHSEAHVLQAMGRPGCDSLLRFRDRFYALNRKYGKKQFLTYYLIAAHPGCTEKDMRALKSFASTKLKLLPEQVQVFTPTPSTYATLMYYTERDPFTGERCFVEKTVKGRERQKSILSGSENKRSPRPA